MSGEFARENKESKSREVRELTWPFYGAQREK
jgi:hypothetical protein